MLDDRVPVTLFLGSGFSAGFGLPTTRQLQERLLEVPGQAADVLRRERFISGQLQDFWEKVFGWAPGRPVPTLEDHFTQIDLAANSGHHLGPSYPPKLLRALRRFTIHRVFKILDAAPVRAGAIDDFLCRLNEAFRLSIVTTNWDLMVERSLERSNIQFNLGVGQVDNHGDPVERRGPPLLKLHGSGNWAYCDCCRNWIMFDPGMGKVAVHLRLLLERDDFLLFPQGGVIADDLDLGLDLRTCSRCGGRLGTRIATFSYRKDLSVRAFQAIWDEAHTVLHTARRWLFIGYSLPEADIEIRHLLKTAQLAQKRHPTIDVVLNDDRAGGERYERFFGANVSVFLGALNAWIAQSLDDFCAYQETQVSGTS